MSRMRLVLLPAAAVLTWAFAPIQTGTIWTTHAAASVPAELRPALERADRLIVTLQGALLKELTRELERGGPAAAMKACHLGTIAEVYRTIREEGVAAGRTSDRLRNPTNAAPPWAEPIVAANAGRRASEVGGFVVELGDRVGVLRPIPVGRMCTGCHGPDAALGQAVRAELRERYPADRAVGFREGDLRGWFWVEMPRPPVNR